MIVKWSGTVLPSCLEYVIQHDCVLSIVPTITAGLGIEVDSTLQLVSDEVLLIELL